MVPNMCVPLNHPGPPRRCPCGREFEGFSQLSTHIRNVHCKPTAAQREGAAIGDALFRM